MARFHTYSVVCPLFEQNNFLGVCLDKDPTIILATLGRNIISKYRLLDQKQVGGWTSKDHITSNAVYDPISKQYIGVFKNKFVKVWDADTQNLDKLKKFKFSEQIVKVEICASIPSILLLKNGNCASTKYALQDKNILQSNPLLKQGENISNSAIYYIDNVYTMCYIVECDNNNEIWLCPLNEELGTIVRSRVVKIKVTSHERDVHIVGKLMNNKSPFVYILWSDSKICSFDLKSLKWRSIGSVQWVSCDNQVSMQLIHDNHLALFGSDQHKDGALVVVYNVKLGISTCRYPLKMYYQGAKLYSFDDNLILEAGNHLALVRFSLEATKSLAKLISSHEITADSSMELASWDEDTVPNIICNGGDRRVELLKMGVSIRDICSQYILPLIEDEKEEFDIESLKQFDDIPEEIVVLLIKNLLSNVNYKRENLIDIQETRKMCDSVPQLKMQLSYLLSLPLSDTLIITHIKRRLKIEDGLFLINFICLLLSEENDGSIPIHERILFNWFLILLDCYYKHNMILKDDTIIKVLRNALTIVEQLINNVKEINTILPKLYFLKRDQAEVEEDRKYSIQFIRLY